MRRTISTAHSPQAACQCVTLPTALCPQQQCSRAHTVQCSAEHQAVRHHTEGTGGAARHAGCSGQMRPCVTARRRRQGSVGQVRECTGPAMPQHTYAQRARNTHSPARLPVLVGRHPGLCHLVTAPSAQHDTVRRGTAWRSQPRHGTTHHGTTRRGKARQRRAHRKTAQPSTAQHGKARHDTARRTKAHHSTTGRDTNRGSNPSQPPHAPEGKETRPQPWDNTTPARRTPARGQRTPGNDGVSPPTQAATRKLKPAPQRRRDTESPTPLNPGPQETALRNRPAGRTRT